MDVNLLHGKAFGLEEQTEFNRQSVACKISWKDTDLWRKMSIALERHSSKVRENQFMLLACSYKFLQQDGAPSHFCHHVRNHLAGRWIGRDGPIAWPPRSPDLTPLGFFLWVCVKNIVCQVKINDLQRPRACIWDAVATVTPNMLQETWNEVEYRLDICRSTKGACGEIYWGIINSERNFDSLRL
jgi:hypothetical protein